MCDLDGLMNLNGRLTLKLLLWSLFRVINVDLV